jgi:hypothetical protein
MCSWAYEREYWLRRVEKLKKEMREEDERRQRERAKTPAQPATPEAGVEGEPQPVPA